MESKKPIDSPLNKSLCILGYLLSNLNTNKYVNNSIGSLDNQITSNSIVSHEPLSELPFSDRGYGGLSSNVLESDNARLNMGSAGSILNEDYSQLETSEQSDEGNNMTQTESPVSTTAKQSKKVTRKQSLLTDPDVKRWHKNLARSSVTTSNVRLYNLGNFCKDHQITPSELAQLGMKDVKATANLLQDHITLMQEKGKSPGYIHSTIMAAKSWLENFDIRIMRRLRIANLGSTPTLQEERVPETSEMEEILDRAPLRVGAAISLVAKAGLRLEVMSNEDGTDGLMIKDLPDIVIEQRTIRCIRTPMKIIVRGSLSKARHQYFTYLTPGGTRKLVAYLNDRLAKGEPLTPDSPVIAPDREHRYGRRTNTKFLRRARISTIIRESLRPRFQWRPYVARAYFDTKLLIAESKGKIAQDFRVFFMGHKGSMEAKYTTNKGILAEALEKEMREAFKRSEEFLDLEVKNEDPILKQKEQAKMALENAPPEKVQEILTMLGICNT